MMKGRTFFEIALLGRDKNKILQKKSLEFFLSQGFRKDEVACFDYPNKFRHCVYVSSLRSSKAIENSFRKNRISGLFFRAKRLGAKAWFDKWKEDYHIQPFGRRFEIVPEWERATYSASKKKRALYVDPGGAFGSGMHETTRLCIRLMEPLDGSMRRCLDLGTGTGILAMAAVHLGAKQVLALDHDEASVQAARKNMEKNHLQGVKVLKRNVKKLTVKKKFDFISANLTSSLLVEMRKRMASYLKENGHLIVSGILKKMANSFLKDFRSDHLRCKRILKGRRWIAVLYQKT